MPNWCEGMLKIRGKQEDVFNFLADNLQVWKTVIVKEPKFDMREELDKEAIEIDREDGSLMGEGRTAIRIDKVIEIVKGGGIDGD